LSATETMTITSRAKASQITLVRGRCDVPYTNLFWVPTTVLNTVPPRAVGNS